MTAAAAAATKTEKATTNTNSQVYMDFSISGESAGRIVFELFDDSVPKTTYNFRTLCTGTKDKEGNFMGYKGSTIHRIINGFMAQGGDFTRGDGRGGKSVYEGGRFDDENFKVTHTGRGLLSMANSGPNTNGSQFFITFAKTEHLDGKHVVFGRIIDGSSVLDKLEAVGSRTGTPQKKVVVTDCGAITKS